MPYVGLLGKSQEKFSGQRRMFYHCAMQPTQTRKRKM